ncbi:MAG: DUF433 domain-containing protein [Planctomycetes bacterium]|jgi:uncharacterized protein (DUF433 family)|nr:DUF433 domain-containing protein [Planctomycetota bacterium]NBU74822.1 DUF433 domain-containing protein [Planctomycetota bacterium]
MFHRISVDPSIQAGRPCVEGTRIPVLDVLELVREGITHEKIRNDYFPDLLPEDIRACVQFAIDVIATETIEVATPA